MDKFLSEKSSKLLVSIGLVIFLVSLISYFLIQFLNIEGHNFTLESYSHIGSFIGGVVGSLFSLAGFVLFYIALNKQKEDLELNRKALKSQIKSMNLQTDEFKAQVKEQEETRKVYIEQSKTQILQRFENTFFNMLSIHHQIVDAIDLEFDALLNPDSELYQFYFSSGLKKNGDKINSRDVFKIGYEIFIELLRFDYFLLSGKEQNHADTIDFFGIDIYNKLSTLSNIYKRFNFDKHEMEIENEKFESSFASIYLFLYDKLSTDFGHYFRNLYRIIKMIDDQNFGEDSEEIEFQRKYYYTSIVRAQLSDYELGWLFFNCIFEYGEKFKPLVEKYAFFKIFDGRNAEFWTHYKKAYQDSAFGLKN